MKKLIKLLLVLPLFALVVSSCKKEDTTAFYHFVNVPDTAWENHYIPGEKWEFSLIFTGHSYINGHEIVTDTFVAVSDTVLKLSTDKNNSKVWWHQSYAKAIHFKGDKFDLTLCDFFSIESGVNTINGVFLSGELQDLTFIVSSFSFNGEDVFKSADSTMMASCNTFYSDDVYMEIRRKL